MKKLIALSSGEYSDYSVNSFWEIDRDVAEDELKGYWKEGIKLKTEFTDSQMIKLADYLKIPVQTDNDDVWDIVGTEKYHEALKAVQWTYKSEQEFFEDILTRHRFVKIEYQEFNVDDF